MTRYSSVISPSASTVPTRWPSIGMRMPSAASVPSKNRAYGDCGPSASTDQSALLWYSGVGTAMWFGTTSTMTPKPRSCAARASDSKPSRPPRASEMRVWSVTS